MGEQGRFAADDEGGVDTTATLLRQEGVQRIAIFGIAGAVIEIVLEEPAPLASEIACIGDLVFRCTDRRRASGSLAVPGRPRPTGVSDSATKPRKSTKFDRFERKPIRVLCFQTRSGGNESRRRAQSARPLGATSGDRSMQLPPSQHPAKRGTVTPGRDGKMSVRRHGGAEVRGGRAESMRDARRWWAATGGHDSAKGGAPHHGREPRRPR